MNLRDLTLRVRALLAPRRVERELDEELSFHLERETEQLVAGGLSPAEARTKALARFGSVALAADQCRDERGTGFIDTTIRDVRYALRGFRRAPLVSVTVVATVGLGLGLVAVAFSVLNMLLFRVEPVPGGQDMFALERPHAGDAARPAFTRADIDAVLRETDVFAGAYAELSGVDARVDGRTLAATFTTGSFFQVVGVSAAMGRTLTPADEEAATGHPAIVLSDRGWERLFARDPAVLGRSLLVNGLLFDVLGVMPRDFRGLSIVAPDFWAPLPALGSMRPAERGRDAAVGVRIVGRLKPNLSRDAAVARLAVWSANRSTREAGARSAAGITLVPWRGTIQQPLDAMLVTGPLFFAFGLILLTGCANVANLLLARAVARQREIGIRLSLGAGRRRIVRQLLTESLLLALAAAAAGLAVSRIVLEVIVNGVLASWPPEIGDIQLRIPDADWRVLLFLAAGACVSTILFGLLPALQATRIEPVATMRGEIVRDARPGRARNFLIGLQVGVSALLLVSAAVFLRSAFAAATEDPGLRVSDTMIVGIPNEAMRTAIVEAVSAMPSIERTAASWPAPITPPAAALAESTGAKAAIAYKFVSPDYFDVLDIPLVRGRAFTSGERSPSLPLAIVSESAARALWPNADPIGRTVRVDRTAAPDTRRDDDPLRDSRMVTVVGVVRDVAGFRMMPFPRAVVYLPTSGAMPGTGLVARVHGNPDGVRPALVKRLAAIDPAIEQAGMEVVGTVAWVTRMETYLLTLAFWVTIALGGLALALTLSGLFSVLSYLVEQRTREIGVRMALGATTLHVTRLVLSQSIVPIGAGLACGAGFAAALAALLLATPGATFGQLVQVLDPIAYAASLFVILTACLLAASLPAARAARLDPSRTLRQD